MTKKQKLLDKLKANPQKIRFEEIDKILLSVGFNKRQPRKGSSHYTYILDDLIVTIPFKRPYVKSKYIKDAVKLLGKLGY